MFELVMILASMIIFGYFHYKGILKRSRSFIETIINQKHKEENCNEKI